MTRDGRTRIRAVIAAASQMADSVELLLDATAPTPGVHGPAPADADGVLLGVLLALADLTVGEHEHPEGVR